MIKHSSNTPEPDIRNIVFFRYRIINHAAFWLFIVGFFASISISNGTPVDKALIYNLVFLHVDMAAVYITIYILIPRFLLRYKIIPFVLLLHLIIICGIIVNYYYKLYVLPSAWILDESETDFFSHAFYTFWILYMEIGLASVIKLLKHWHALSIRKAELEKSNFQSELALLRSQINPHFLFNTLNNIYSLVLKKDPMAPEAVMKLSEMLRYSLNDSGTARVSMDDELQYIESYIALQKLRLQDPSYIDFRVEGEPHRRMIAPMLLIPVIENAFKHGLKKTVSPGVIIRLVFNGHDTTLSVRNYMNTTESQEKSSGIGLQNLRRRLALLYPGRHELIINQNDKEFRVELKLTDV